MRPLTVIAAPAGFGKTTALSEWIPTCKHCVSWLSLDDGDNDPARFWIYVVAAVQKLRADLGGSALEMLQLTQPPPITSILTTLINEIALFPDDFSIVLDDYHLIKTQAIHEALTFLLDHLPPNMRVILTARADPPLPLSRLRARNQLAELRASDLRFTPEEAAVFLNDVMGLELSANDVVALETRTEGWIAGLQLAALSMQGRDDVSSFIKAFSGSNRHVLNYLIEEVLEQRPQGTLNFLLQTSILDRLSGSLCDALTGQNGGQATLEKLERANFFLLPLDEEANWFRYHHLFAEILHMRLKQTYPDQLAGLHIKASVWFEKNNLWVEAVNHALTASDFERAAYLIEQTGMEAAHRGQVHAVFGWLNALPEAWVRTKPKLSVLYAWLLLSYADYENADRRLQDAEAATQDQPATDAPRELQNTHGEIFAMKALQAVYRRGFDSSQIIAWAEQALQDLHPDNTSFRSTAIGALGAAYRNQRDLVRSEQAFAKAAATIRAAQNVMSATMHQTIMQRARGALSLAIATCRQALAWASETDLESSPFNGTVYSHLADLLRERNELEEAQRLAAEGVMRCAQIGNPHQYLSSILILARVKLAAGDPSGAFEAILQAQQLAQQYQAEWFQNLMPAIEIQFHLAQGDLPKALQWLSEAQTKANAWRDFVGSYEFIYAYEIGQIAPAQIIIAHGRATTDSSLLRQAIAQLDEKRQDGETTEILWYQVKILILQALAYHALGEISTASGVFERALTLAAPEGYVRIFLDEGMPIQLLLADCRSRIKHANVRAYLDRIVAAVSGVDLAPLIYSTDRGSNSTLMEPLSGRELEVLRLIANGLSNRDIAEQLIISTVTVKTHINNIFSKLYVRSRTQAVARAHELGLLTH